MLTIQFKARVRTRFSVEDEPLYDYIDVPVLTRSHCDMNAFRTSNKYGGYANSDLFPGMLAGIRRKVFQGKPLRLDLLPEGVTVDTSKFLAVVTIAVGDSQATCPEGKQ